MPRPIRESRDGGSIMRRTDTSRLPNPPPGGNAGLAQQTTASQLTTMGPFIGVMRRRAPPRRRVSRQKRAATFQRRRAKRAGRITVRAPKKRAHLVKGSVAAKRYMAKLRRKQKRRR